MHTAMPPFSFTIKVPCSSANIGPGFDVIGLALSLYLELHVTVDSSKSSSEHPLNCVITYEDPSKSEEKISVDPEVNLITRVALYVLRCHDQRSFPVETRVHIVNPIPLGRGLGSSGTAVVAGVMLASRVGGLALNKERMLDYCLMIGEVDAKEVDIYILTDQQSDILIMSLHLSSEASSGRISMSSSPRISHE